MRQTAERDTRQDTSPRASRETPSLFRTPITLLAGFTGNLGVNMHKLLRLLVLVVFAASLAGCASVPRHYVCHRANGAVFGRCKLSDPAWARAPWTEYFVDIEGDKKPRPPFKTHARLLWDDEYLYIGAELEEPDVWATLKHRDDIVFHDNDFEVFIDPAGQAGEYYELEFNAFGTVFDLYLEHPYRAGGSPAHHEWNLEGLKSAVYVDGTVNNPRDHDEGWSVELALPWSALAEHAHRPSPPRPGDVWRINFSRVEWPVKIVSKRYQKAAGAKEDNWGLVTAGRLDMHQPEHWGYVEFAR